MVSINVLVVKSSSYILENPVSVSVMVILAVPSQLEFRAMLPPAQIESLRMIKYPSSINSSVKFVIK